MLMGWIVSRRGRWARMATGASLVMGGLARGSTSGRVLSLVGLVALVEGAVDVFLLGPLFGLPVAGASLRRQVGVLGEDSLWPHFAPPQTDRTELMH